MIEIIVLALAFVLACSILIDWVYNQGYAKGWDDSVIHEYEKDFQ